MSGTRTVDSSNGLAPIAADNDAVSVVRESAAFAMQAIAPPRFEARAFHPRLFLSNGHLQTIAGNFLPRANALPEPVPELVEVSPGSDSQIASNVLCECHWHPLTVRASRPTVILLHGLEGSSESQYVVGNANKMWRAGANVIRMNMRNCGGTERLSPTLYHSGLSCDVGFVLRHFIEREHLNSVALVGYSMGGNVVLKLAGELGADAPRQLHSVVAVSPSIDLGPTADALHRRANRIYERRFLRRLIKRFRFKARLFPRAYNPRLVAGVRSLREYDERITALYSGFASADDYYYRASAARVVDRIHVPTLVLHALDDPFVLLTPQTRTALVANPFITLLESEHGGHCAFLAKPGRGNGDDGYWAETTLLRFILDHA
ncbi:MAG TPA: alpha/beta fold hydrolase [Acidobacteriaceae bacterium]|jgi:predicted alpha/beta-fold hydrolase|nr:alpha/beta fold hydrolase [Acidobacteriaceae bacterium]